MHPIGNIQHLLIVLIRPDGLNPLTPCRAFLLCGETGGTFGGAFSLWGATVGTFVAGWVMQSEGRSELLILTHVVVKLVAPLLVLFLSGVQPLARLSVLSYLGLQPLAPLLIINGCFWGIFRQQRCWGFHPAACVSRRWWHWFHLLVDESGERHR